MDIKGIKIREDDNFEEEVEKLREKYDKSEVEKQSSENRHKNVGAIIVDGKKILLIKRSVEPFEGTWTLPGGHIEKGELDVDAVMREVKEETGLDFKPNYFGSYEESFEKIGWFAYLSVFTGEFKGKIDKRKLNKQEVEDAKWFGFDELQDLKIGFEHKKIIEEYLSSIS